MNYILIKYNLCDWKTMAIVEYTALDHFCLMISNTFHFSLHVFQIFFTLINAEMLW
jgi:hypothetical protein